MNIRRVSTLAVVFFLVQGASWAANPGADEDVQRLYGDAGFVSLATGSTQPIARAPAVATVITAADIANMGATDLDQVLETVPGLHVAYSYLDYNPIYTIRGIFALNNPQVLVMLNGIPLTQAYSGDRSLIWGGMPVRDIARIEVIRGPGSALYGSEALAGVINIVTKTARDAAGVQPGVGAGSFKTGDLWVLQGGSLGGLDVAFSLQAHRTDGHDRKVDADLQTALDGVFSSNASRAPGSVNLARKTLDSRLDLALGDWQMRLGFQGRYDMGVGVGVAPALDPDGEVESRRRNADITYKKVEIAPDLDLSTQMSYLDETNSSYLYILPAGAFGGAFPNGMIGTPGRQERNVRFNIAAKYYGIANHQIRFGASTNRSRLDHVRESKNFEGVATPLAGTPPPVTDVSDDPSRVYIRPHTRRDNAVYAQDEWMFAPDWELTAGLRFDHYSDFGNTTNPRLALVWQTHYNLTTKLLYGRAFRAPSFQELYIINNPSALGNPDLGPEKIDTTEIAADYRFNESASLGVNLYFLKIRNKIALSPTVNDPATSTYDDTGKQTGHGLEVEWKQSFTRMVRITANYAYQVSVNKDVDKDAGNAPRHEVYVRSDWTFVPSWSAHAQATWVGSRGRVPGDTRDDLDAYTWVDLGIRYGGAPGGWNVAMWIHNVFDADAREPAPSDIPNDLPLAGRSFYVETSYGLR